MGMHFETAHLLMLRCDDDTQNSYRSVAGCDGSKCSPSDDTIGQIWTLVPCQPINVIFADVDPPMRLDTV